MVYGHGAPAVRLAIPARVPLAWTSRFIKTEFASTVLKFGSVGSRCNARTVGIIHGPRVVRPGQQLFTCSLQADTNKRAGSWRYSILKAITRRSWVGLGEMLGADF